MQYVVSKIVFRDCGLREKIFKTTFQGDNSTVTREMSFIMILSYELNFNQFSFGYPLLYKII